MAFIEDFKQKLILPELTNVGTTFLPGRGDLRRNMEKDLKKMKDEKIQFCVLLANTQELEGLHIPTLPQEIEKTGIKLVHEKISEDPGVPSYETMEEIVGLILKAADEGKKVAILSRSGLGRACAVLVCCLLKKNPLWNEKKAMQVVRDFRGWRSVDEHNKHFFHHFAQVQKKEQKHE